MQRPPIDFDDAALLDLLLECESQEERQALLEANCGNNALGKQWMSYLLKGYSHGEFIESLPDRFQFALELPRQWIGSIVGNYEIIDGLGTGGMGDVYLACDVATRRTLVAIKVVKADFNSASVLRRFALERKILERFDHANIARFIDSGESESGYLYFAMEYIPGVAIDAFCKQTKLSLRERVQLVLAVCDGLNHAHQNGVIHRDIKPNNILVHQQGGVAVPKIIDFGISKALSTPEHDSVHITLAQHWVGTMRYASPEQLKWASNVDERSDVFSLGVVLYELVCGNVPYDLASESGVRSDLDSTSKLEQRLRRPIQILDSNTTEQLRETALQRSTTVKELRREVRGRLEWILNKATATRVDSRYHSIAQFQSDLQNWLTNKPLVAKPGSWDRSRRSLLRFGFAAVLAITVGVLLWVGGTVFYPNAAEQAGGEQMQVGIDLKAAFDGLEQGDMQIVEESLSRATSQMSAKKSYHFAINYLQDSMEAARTQRELKVPNLSAAGISPDGQWIAIGTLQGELFLFDSQTHQQHRRIVLGQKDIYQVRFSPNGKKLAVCGSDQKIWVISTATFEVESILSHHDNTISALAWSPSSGELCTGDRFGEICLWSVGPQQLEQVLRERTDESATIHTLDWSPDGQFIAASMREQGVGVWEARTRKMRFQQAIGETTSVAFSKDCELLYTGGWFHDINVTDLKSGATIERIPLTANSLRLATYNDQTVISTSSDGLIHVFTKIAKQGKSALQRRASHSEEPGSYNTVIVDRPNRQFAFASEAGGKVVFRDEFSMLGMRHQLAKLYAVACFPEHHLLFSYNEQIRRLYAIDLSTGKAIWEMDVHLRIGCNFSMSRDAENIAIIEIQNNPKNPYRVHVLDSKTGQLYRTIDWADPSIENTSFSPSGKRLVLSGSTMDAVVDLETGKLTELPVASEHQEAGVRVVLFGAKENEFYQHCEGGQRLSIRSLEPGESDVQISLSTRCYFATPDLDGNLLVGGAARIEKVDLTKRSTSTLLRWTPSRTHGSGVDMVNDFCFSPSRDLLAISSGPRVHLWDWRLKLKLTTFVGAGDSSDMHGGRWTQFYGDSHLLFCGRAREYLTIIGQAPLPVLPPGYQDPE